jgi:NADPH-dependent curcumin reductase CurA
MEQSGRAGVARNRQVLLVARPQGIPAASDFEIVYGEIPKAGPGEFVVKNLFLSVDPAQRGWASAEANYSAPLPLGSVMRALAVGVVIESAEPGVAVGAHLYGWFGWQDFCAAKTSDIVRKVDPDAAPLSATLGVLGLNGVTALIAFEELGRPKSGETIIVSTAAGGVGSVVGQLARDRGLRAIGLTSDARKIALCRDAFGYEAAINYRETEDLAVSVKGAAPRGIDIFFDNTGGWIADAIIPLMNVAGRIVQCGTASVSSWIPVPGGPRREREVLTKRLHWSGFVIFDHLDKFDKAAKRLQNLVAQGTLAYREEILDGIEHAPGAIVRLYEGGNLGRLVLRL